MHRIVLCMFLIRSKDPVQQLLHLELQRCTRKRNYTCKLYVVVRYLVLVGVCVSDSVRILSLACVSLAVATLNLQMQGKQLPT